MVEILDNIQRPGERVYDPQSRNTYKVRSRVSKTSLCGHRAVIIGLVRVSYWCWGRNIFNNDAKKTATNARPIAAKSVRFRSREKKIRQRMGKNPLCPIGVAAFGC